MYGSFQLSTAPPASAAESPRSTGEGLRTLQKVRAIKAKYDAAQDTDQLRKYYANADALSANAANSFAVRKKLWMRSRYEYDNNSYYQGMVQTSANDLIGTGPRLKILTANSAFNRQIETRFNDGWAKAINLADKLRLKKQAKTRDGETFSLISTNESLQDSVQLDLQVFECERCTTSDLNFSVKEGRWIDGIEFDKFNNPIAYHILNEHPGDFTGTSGYKRIAARFVLHWFRQNRPGQSRGIPEAAPSLPLFAMLRRFTLATVTAAETAAMFAALLETPAPANTTEIRPPEEFEELEIAMGMMTTLPMGSKLAQFKAEHPTTTYDSFKKALLQEIARALHIPYNVAAGDSSSYNFSSAKLDHMIYRSDLRVERADCEQDVLRPLAQAWLEEATKIPGYLPEGTPILLSNLPHKWNWPAWQDIDAKTDADADAVRLANGTTNRAKIYAERGEDADIEIAQWMKEQAVIAGKDPAPVEEEGVPVEQA